MDTDGLDEKTPNRSQPFARFGAWLALFEDPVDHDTIAYEMKGES